MRTIIALYLVSILSSCANTTTQYNRKDVLLSKLEQIQTSERIGPNEVLIIFGSYGECYPQSTAFHLGGPALHKGEWVAPVYLGDIAPLLSDESLVLDPKTGKMYFAKSGEVVVNHFKEMLENCNI